jgi:hypothetical protein
MEAQEAIGALLAGAREIELARPAESLGYGASLFRVLAELPVALKPS